MDRCTLIIRDVMKKKKTEDMKEKLNPLVGRYRRINSKPK